MQPSRGCHLETLKKVQLGCSDLYNSNVGNTQGKEGGGATLNTNSSPQPHSRFLPYLVAMQSEGPWDLDISFHRVSSEWLKVGILKISFFFPLLRENHGQIMVSDTHMKAKYKGQKNSELWPVLLPHLLQCNTLASPCLQAWVPREKQDLTLLGPAAHPSAGSCTLWPHTQVWPWEPPTASPSTAHLAFCTWGNFPLRSPSDHKVEVFRAPLPPALIGLTEEGQVVTGSTAASALPLAPLVSSPELSVQTGLPERVFHNIDTRRAPNPRDSPLALLPHDMLPALAHSRGPTAHGGDCSTNVTPTPWKSGNNITRSPHWMYPRPLRRGNHKAQGGNTMPSFLCHILHLAGVWNT